MRVQDNYKDEITGAYKVPGVKGNEGYLLDLCEVEGYQQEVFVLRIQTFKIHV